MIPIESVRDLARCVVQLPESEAKRLSSAEVALHRIADMLGIVVEVGEDGCYDAATLLAQVMDAMERRQAGGSV